MGEYEHEHTKEWADTIDGYDGFIFVTPEYNHSTSGALKNALDYLYAEWNNKACAFVGYGSQGGARAVEHLRTITSELQLAHVRQQVALSLYQDWEDFTDFRPEAQNEEALDTLFDSSSPGPDGAGDGARLTAGLDTPVAYFSRSTARRVR